MTWTRASSHLINWPLCQTSAAIRGVVTSFALPSFGNIILFSFRTRFLRNVAHGVYSLRLAPYEKRSITERSHCRPGTWLVGYGTIPQTRSPLQGRLIPVGAGAYHQRRYGISITKRIVRNFLVLRDETARAENDPACPAL